VGEPNDKFVDDAILSHAAGEEFHFEIGRVLRNKDLCVKFAEGSFPGRTGAHGHVDQRGMIGHGGHRCVGVLLLKLRRCMRFPDVDQLPLRFGELAHLWHFLLGASVRWRG